MIAVNVVAINLSSIVGLILSMFCLVTGMAFLWVLPPHAENGEQEGMGNKPRGDIKKPLMLLIMFAVSYTHLDVYKRQEEGFRFRYPVEHRASR